MSATGVYGIPYGHWIFGNGERHTLSKAAFAYFRDSMSLKKARLDGVKAAIIGWSPDVVFALDVADDAAAARLLAKHGLKDGEFLCCIPKQRSTPTWLHVRKKRQLDGRLNQRNEEMKELDHASLREAIIAVTRRTGMKVLICNVDETEIGKTWVLDHLPEDVRRKWYSSTSRGCWRKQSASTSARRACPATRCTAESCASRMASRHRQPLGRAAKDGCGMTSGWRSGCLTSMLSKKWLPSPKGCWKWQSTRREPQPRR